MQRQQDGVRATGEGRGDQVAYGRAESAYWGMGANHHPG